MVLCSFTEQPGSVSLVVSLWRSPGGWYDRSIRSQLYERTASLSQGQPSRLFGCLTITSLSSSKKTSASLSGCLTAATSTIFAKIIRKIEFCRVIPLLHVWNCLCDLFFCIASLLHGHLYWLYMISERYTALCLIFACSNGTLSGSKFRTHCCSACLASFEYRFNRLL